MPEPKKPYIFIDTCSLLISCWNPDPKSKDSYIYSKEKDDMFWGHEFASLTRIGDVIIPKRNYDELVKHAGKQKNQDLANRSKQILNRVNEYVQKGLIQIVGDPNDPFADAILLSVALRFKTQRDQAFITQDYGLAEDLEAICHFRSLSDHYGFPNYDIKVRKITKTGELKPFKGLRKALRERYQDVSEAAATNIASNNSGSPKKATKKKDGEPKAKPTKPRKNWWDA